MVLSSDQWSAATITKTGDTVTINLPITVSEIFHVITAEVGTHIHESNANNLRSHSYTTTTFKIVTGYMIDIGTDGVRWVAICK